MNQSLSSSIFSLLRCLILGFVSRDSKGHGDRDVFNEKPTREEQTIASAHEPGPKQSNIAHSATIHTTSGDIHLKLFPEHAPKAVENFVVLSRKGYFDNVIFHRVIKKFVESFVHIFSILDLLNDMCSLDDSDRRSSWRWNRRGIHMG